MPTRALAPAYTCTHACTRTYAHEVHARIRTRDRMCICVSVHADFMSSERALLAFYEAHMPRERLCLLSPISEHDGSIKQNVAFC